MSTEETRTSIKRGKYTFTTNASDTQRIFWGGMDKQVKDLTEADLKKMHEGKVKSVTCAEDEVPAKKSAHK